MPKTLPAGLTDCLLWSEELGYGWHPREPMSYDGDYFRHYQELDATPMGIALTRARVDLVHKYCNPETTLDVGIGGGRFVLESGGVGYDVSRNAVDWLQARYLYQDPYTHDQEAITCWDSLEHIPDPEALVARAARWLFVSMPTYRNAAGVLRSKHYKPGEHLWYFSDVGFVNWAEAHGFRCLEINQAESELGREGITSFVFRRVSA